MNKIKVSKEIEFDMGHRIPNHKSKCSHPHGHRYKVVAVVSGPLHDTEDTNQGMVIDFGDLKKILMEKIHDVYDHGFMVHDQDPLGYHLTNFESEDFQGIMNCHYVNFIPTAENLAHHFFGIVDVELVVIDWPLRLIELQVHETPTSVATCTREYGSGGGTDEL